MNRRTRGKRTHCEECISNLTDGIFKTSFYIFFPRVPRILRFHLCEPSPVLHQFVNILTLTTCK